LENDGIYIAGDYMGAVDFDPGPGINLIASNGSYDVYLTKFDFDGNLQWVRTWGSVNQELERDLLYEDNGVYVIGGFWGECDFNTGPGQDVHTGVDFFDCFVSRHDSNGTYEWAQTWGGSNWDMASGISSNGSGQIDISGSFRMECDFDPGDESYELNSIGDKDAFLTRFDNLGNWKGYAVSWGGTGLDETAGIETTPVGNTYVIGTFSGTADFDPGAGVEEHTSAGALDSYISLFNQSGDLDWVRIWGKTDLVEAFAIDYDSFGNRLLIAGTFFGSCDFDVGPGDNTVFSTGQYDAYLLNLSLAGDYNWARTWGGPISPFAEAYGIGINKENILVGGEFSETVDFEPGPGIEERTAVQASDCYLMKLNADGEF
jgi:hypothetical protein